jgi:hypothetical protein
MAYQQFRRFSLDPKNEREVLDLAINRAYQASGGTLNAFNAGSPLVTVLESLTSVHMEFLFWLNSLPEAMILTYMAEVLNSNRNLGSKCQATIQITLTKPLGSSFLLKAGTKVFSSSDSDIAYLFDNDLVIPAGSVTGFVLASSESLGPSSAVGPNELTELLENFSYVQSVTNLASSTIGSNPETLEEVRDRVQTLMSQQTPVSIQDWLNVCELYFPGKASNAKIEDGILYLYVQDYVVNTTFETYVNQKITALQKAIIAPFERADLQITITSTLDFDNQQCIEIAQEISRDLLNYTNRQLQPIDIYNNIANEFLDYDRDLDKFEVLYYYKGLAPNSLQTIELQPYDFVGGQVLKDFSNQYFVVNNDFNVVSNAFDDAGLGYLEYHPVYLTLGPGDYSTGDVVLVLGQYYLVTSSGAFNPTNTTNWVLLPAPQTWTNNLSLTTADFLLEPSANPGLGHGFIPVISYTTAQVMSTNWASISPSVVSSGASVAPNQYWSLLGFEEVIYLNNTTSNYVVNPATAPIDQLVVEVYRLPSPLYSTLTRKSKYQIGQIVDNNNKIVTNSLGNTTNIPTGLVITGSSPSPQYGTFIKDFNNVYEVIESFIPSPSDTINTLLAGGFIKKAYEVYGDFDYLVPASRVVPYYFDIELVYFQQQNSKVVKKTGSTYTVVDL